jgi:hypothetical protein
MMVFVWGLSLGPENLDKQVSLVARNAVEEGEIRRCGRFVGKPSLEITSRLPVRNVQKADLALTLIDLSGLQRNARSIKRPTRVELLVFRDIAFSFRCQCPKYLSCE